MPFDDETDGICALTALTGNEELQEKHEFLFWDFTGKGGQKAVRMGKWKGIKKNLKKNPHASLQLYNLETDIEEQNEVSKKHPEVSAKIEALMLSERTRPELKRFQFGNYQ